VGAGLIAGAGLEGRGGPVPARQGRRRGQPAREDRAMSSERDINILIKNNIKFIYSYLLIYIKDLKINYIIINKFYILKKII
jgi:hypothetical protein